MVYITPGLFGQDHTHAHRLFQPPIHAHVQSHMVESQLTAGLGKRKRRADDEKDMPSAKHISMASLDTTRPGPSVIRTTSTSEGHIRNYGHSPASHETSMQRAFSRSPKFALSERRPIKQVRRLLTKSPSHLMDTELDLMPSSPSVQKAIAHTKSDLSPCHVCSTAPKRKRDLEGYMDCRRCTERTCYICARECLGCQRAMCKECIVELGQDGEPWCLDCYQHINT